MYTPHEIRTIIRNCKTIAQLLLAEFILLPELPNYTRLQVEVFKNAIAKQKAKLLQYNSL